jgi:hypothetical protein
LVYRNFHAILRWNRSILYALSVGHLSDRLNGQPMLIAESADEPSLSRDDVKINDASGGENNERAFFLPSARLTPKDTHS